MADAGLKLTINSDDPTMFSIDLADEYITLHDVMDFSLDKIVEFALNGVDAAWVGDSTKQQWRQEWSSEIESLLTEVV